MLQLNTEYSIIVLKQYYTRILQMLQLNTEYSKELYKTRMLQKHNIVQNIIEKLKIIIHYH